MPYKGFTDTEQTLIKIHSHLTDYYLKKIEEFTAPHPSLKSQIDQHRKYFSKVPITTTDDRGLKKAIHAHKIICLGDYHAFTPSQNEFLDLIQTAHREGESLVVVLESLPSDSRSMIELYLNSTITFGELMEDIDFEKTWGFDSYSTLKLLNFCKKHKIPIIGMNLMLKRKISAGELFKKREAHFCKVLRQIHKDRPAAKVFSLVGNLHLLPDNLPKLWPTQEAPDVLYIHQNCDEVYTRKGADQPHIDRQIFKIDAHNFVVMNTHPWIKHHSYWHVLETAIEYDDLSSEEFLEERQFRQQDQFHQVISQLKTLLHLKIPKLHFSIYSELELSLPFLIKESDMLSHQEKKVYFSLHKHHIPFFVPQLNLLFRPQHTSNTMVDACTRILHSETQKWHFHFRGEKSNFYSWAILEAYVFFVSKLMNPSRKTPTLEKLAEMMSLNKIWKDCLPVLKNTQMGAHNWDPVARFISQNPKAPQMQYLFAQWVGRVWGQQWVNHYITQKDPSVFQCLPPQNPHNESEAKALFTAYMAKIPLRLEI